MVLMERTEQALVPEWLRCAGNAAGVGASIHHSDISPHMHPARNRSFRSNSEKDSSRLVNGSSLSDSRRISSCNGSAKHPYSSFTRSHREKNRDRVREIFSPEDNWDRSSLDPLESLFTSGAERSVFRRYQSLVSRKPDEVLPHIVEDLKSSIVRQSNSNGVTAGESKPSDIQKSAFKKDFPTLGTEEKQDMTRIRRVLSPDLSSVQSPIGNSVFLGGDRWTSALAEVPDILANSGMSHSSLQQNVAACTTSASGPSCAAGLNMAETLSHPPARVGVTPLLPDKSQRLEKLAIKQSRQLIPMTPSMPKPLGLNSGDKSRKPKIGVQPQPHSPNLSYQSRAIPGRSDSTRTSHIGKYLVLKPGRENGVTVVKKDASVSIGDADSKVLDGQHVTSPLTRAVSTSLNKPMVSVFENKVATLALSSSSIGEKRSSQSLAQSRSEFFKLMRRKTTPGAATTLSNSNLACSSPIALTQEEILKEGHAPVSHHTLDECNQMVCNDNGHCVPEKSKNFSDVKENLVCNGQICPDEEEAAFLRSLGWEENDEEDEGLTEEEINAFYQEYMNRRPSLNVCGGSLPNHTSLPEICSDISCIASSESSSSDSEA